MGADEARIAEGQRRLTPRVAALFRPHRGRVLLLGVTILVASGLGVVNPLLTKVVFDSALFPPEGGPDLTLLWKLALVMVAIGVLGGILSVVQTYLAVVVGQRVMQGLRDRLYAHLQRMSLRFFTATRTGEIQSRIANDVNGVQTVVTDTASSILTNIVYVVSSVIAMTVLSWQLTVLSLFVIPAFVYLAYRVGKVRRRLSSETQRSLAELSAMTEETLSVSGILLAKVFGRQRDAIERYGAENRRLAELQVRQRMAGRTFFATVQTFFSITPVFVYVAAGYATGYNFGPEISAGTIVAFTVLQRGLFWPVTQMLQVSVEIQSSMALFERVFQYLDLPQEIVDSPRARTVAKEETEGAIAYRGVFFRYDAGPELALPAEDAGAGDGREPVAAGAPGGDGAGPRRRPWTLEDIDLEVGPGQLAALVGPSGAGKTTLAYLVPRLYDVTRGAVELDGIDVREITLASLADVIGMVTQETYLFHTSVRDNLLYARPGATDAEIEAAAKAANIHDRVLALSAGYETEVGERGYRMSGGEKQRLAIARVILKDPRILILDEATSALDTRSERLVQTALRPLMAGRTTIAIAHRLSTIMAADVIFVLDSGRIEERGQHRQLLELDGLYASLYREQFAGGLVEARCDDGVVLSSGDVVELAARR